MKNSPSPSAPVTVPANVQNVALPALMSSVGMSLLGHPSQVHSPGALQSGAGSSGLLPESPALGSTPPELSSAAVSASVSASVVAWPFELSEVGEASVAASCSGSSTMRQAVV